MTQAENKLEQKESGLQRWSALSAYEKFEQAIVIILTGIIAVVVIAAVWNLLREVLLGLLFGALDPLQHSVSRPYSE